MKLSLQMVTGFATFQVAKYFSEMFGMTLNGVECAPAGDVGRYVFPGLSGSKTSRPVGPVRTARAPAASTTCEYLLRRIEHVSSYYSRRVKHLLDPPVEGLTECSDCRLTDELPTMWNTSVLRTLLPSRRTLRQPSHVPVRGIRLIGMTGSI